MGKFINSLNKSQIIGIYQIINVTNGLSYIGQSKNVYNRFMEHKSALTNNRHHNKKMQKDFNSNHEFKIKIIEECSLEDLDEKETFYIKYYNSINNGYNATYGGSCNFHTPETIQKECIAQKKVWENNIGRKCFNALNAHKDITIEKIRQEKLALAMAMDKKEIEKLFSISWDTLQRIYNFQSFVWIIPETNKYIYKLRELENISLNKSIKHYLKNYINGKNVIASNSKNYIGEFEYKMRDNYFTFQEDKIIRNIFYMKNKLNWSISKIINYTNLNWNTINSILKGNSICLKNRKTNRKFAMFYIYVSDNQVLFTKTKLEVYIEQVPYYVLYRRVHLWEKRLRLKPSIENIYKKINYDGTWFIKYKQYKKKE